MTKQDFIKQLAKFLCSTEAMKSMELQMGGTSALEWQALRSATPLFGYYPGEEGLERAEKQLTEFLK